MHFIFFKIQRSCAQRPNRHRWTGKEMSGVSLTSSHNHTLPPEHHSLHHSSPLRASPPARTHTHGHPRTAHTIASAPNQPTQHIGWQTRRHEFPSLSAAVCLSLHNCRTEPDFRPSEKVRRDGSRGGGRVRWSTGVVEA